MIKSNVMHVVKLVLDPKYFLGRTDATWRKLMSEDIKDMHPLQLDLLANPPEHKSNEDATAIGGSVYGGRCFSDVKMCRKFALECWELAKQWPAARSNFWHSDAADNYMVKMVLHLDGPGLVTLPLPTLVGSSEDANQTVLTSAQLKKVEKERRGNVLVIDKYGPHLQKTKQRRQGASSSMFQSLAGLMDTVRSWLPAELKKYADVAYDQPSSSVAPPRQTTWTKSMGMDPERSSSTYVSMVIDLLFFQ